MSKATITDFSQRIGSPFKTNTSPDKENNIYVEIVNKSYEQQKEKQNELLDKVNKKTAAIQSTKPRDGCFTEIVTHGAFTSKNNDVKTQKVSPVKTLANGNGQKSCLLGFPSSANDLALDAKSDLESDPNISEDVKNKVIEKLFTLVSMVQHIYESKVRVMSDFEKFKDTHMKNEVRKEREHAEQLYKLSMSFQADVIQAIQQLKSELDMSRNISKTSLDTENLQNGVSEIKDGGGQLNENS